MRKKRGIILAAGLLAGLGGLLWLLFFGGEPEPVYQGTRLSAWLEAYAYPGPYNQKEAQASIEALRHIGTNAIPTLLRMLRARDSRWKVKLVDLAEKQHILKPHHRLARDANQRAELAFRSLGAEAKDAVPALMAILEENISPSSQIATIISLGDIGPDAKAAAPLLLKWATDTNNASPYSEEVRLCAIGVLRLVHAEKETVVPAMTKALGDPSQLVRMVAARVLGEFGPDAKAAVPALFELLKDPQSGVRLAAASAIMKIDLEAAALRKTELDAALAWPER